MRPDGPLVSLIMPVWNPRPEWLLAAVRSALAQSGCRLELLVVDDGNPEPVESLLAEVDDDRLRVQRVPHGGECAARNAGSQSVAGDVIRHLDADDIYPVDSTAHLLASMGPRYERIAYGSILQVTQDLQPLWRMACDLRGDVTHDCLLGRFTVRTHAMAFPRDVVERVGPWDAAFTVSHDWDWVLRATEIAQVEGSRHIGSVYRRHDAAATADTEAGLRGARRVMQLFFERHPELRGTPLHRSARALLAAHRGRLQATHGEPVAALRSWGRAASLDPQVAVEDLQRSLGAGRTLLGRHLRALL